MAAFLFQSALNGESAQTGRTPTPGPRGRASPASTPETAPDQAFSRSRADNRRQRQSARRRRPGQRRRLAGPRRPQNADGLRQAHPGGHGGPRRDRHLPVLRWREPDRGKRARGARSSRAGAVPARRAGRLHAVVRRRYPQPPLIAASAYRWFPSPHSHSSASSRSSISTGLSWLSRVLSTTSAGTIETATCSLVSAETTELGAGWTTRWTHPMQSNRYQALSSKGLTTRVISSGPNSTRSHRGHSAVRRVIVLALFI